MNLCRCGLPAKIVTSWTDNNPGRRFFGCPLYKVLVESIAFTIRDCDGFLIHLYICVIRRVGLITAAILTGSMKEWWMDGQKKH